MDEPQWTLRELIAEVATQLARNYEATDNGQIRPIPDERSIRYYTSLGLIDRAAAMRGRTALYGERHLAQLVAIKRLQAQGETLAAIQARLLGLSTARLRALAEPPAGEPAGPAPPIRPPVAPFQGVPVSDSVIVMLQSKRELTRDDVEAIAVASAPLLRALRARHLVEED